VEFISMPLNRLTDFSINPQNLITCVNITSGCYETVKELACRPANTDNSFHLFDCNVMVFTISLTRRCFTVHVHDTFGCRYLSSRTTP